MLLSVEFDVCHYDSNGLAKNADARGKLTSEENNKHVSAD